MDQAQRAEPIATPGTPWPRRLPEEERLPGCEERLGYQFQSEDLLRSALTHASGALHRLASNERLEFLGDSLLGAVVCELLYRNYPDFLEGELTRIKSAVVSRQTCARISAKLGLADFVIVGKGVTNTPTIPTSILADLFESLIAAIYLDGGYQVTKEFIERQLAEEVKATIANGDGDNYKSLLQQYSQRHHGCTPDYELVKERGPDHAKEFLIQAVVEQRQFEPAWGQNKKEAEQLAARNALIDMEQRAAEEEQPDSSDNTHQQEIE